MYFSGEMEASPLQYTGAASAPAMILQVPPSAWLQDLAESGPGGGLGVFVRLFSMELGWSAQGLRALAAAGGVAAAEELPPSVAEQLGLSSASAGDDAPSTRAEAFKLFFEWLRIAGRKACAEPAACAAVESIAVAGFTDVWSAIRKASAGRVAALAETLAAEQLLHVFQRLVDIANASEEEESDWKAKEGAIMAMAAICRRFHFEKQDPAAGKTSSLPRSPAGQFTPTKRRTSISISPADISTYVLKLGGTSFTALPGVVQSNMGEVVFRLLQHPQLSVRENATKAYSDFLSRTSIEEVKRNFSVVMDRLGRTTAAAGGGGDDPAGQLLEAYEAEGLFSLCAILVKMLPSPWLSEEWQRYAGILDRYLAHPASTVRQVVSQMFFYLASRTNGSLPLTRCALAQLTAGWPETPRADRLRQPTEDGGKIAAWLDSRVVAALPWQWKEGRLLSYELLVSFLLSNHAQCMLLTSGGRDPSPQRMPSPLLRSPMALSGLVRSPGSGHNLGVSLLQRLKALDAVAEDVEGGDDEAAEATSPVGRTGISTQKPALDLRRVLLHTLACFGDARWEVRRMAGQVLPRIVEVLVWFDASVLSELWSELSSSTSVLFCYTACLAFRHAIAKSHGLRAQLRAQNNADNEQVLEFITSVGGMVPTVVPRLHTMMVWENDRLSLVCTEALVMARAHSGVTAGPAAQVTTVLSKLTLLQAMACPDNATTLRIFLEEPNSHGAADEPQQDDTPVRGRTTRLGTLLPTASAATHTRELKAKAEQAQRQFVSKVAGWLPDFVHSCAVHQAVVFLPLIVGYLVEYDDATVQKSLCETIVRVLALPLRALGLDSPELVGEDAFVQLSPPPPARNSSAPGGDGPTTPVRGAGAQQPAFSPQQAAFSPEQAAEAPPAGAGHELPDGLLANVLACCVPRLVGLACQPNLELAIVKAALKVLEMITVLVGDDRYKHLILPAFAERMHESMLADLASPRAGSPSDEEAGGQHTRSHAFSPPPEEDEGSDWDTSDDDEQSGDVSALMGTEAGGSSDSDWDEEEALDTDFVKAFGMCAKRISGEPAASGVSRSSIGVTAETAAEEPPENAVIAWLLSFPA